MICENCHGIPQHPPCPSCGGTGIMNCCEGPVGNALDVGNNQIEHGKPSGIINDTELPPEPLPKFNRCEGCEDFDECLGIGVCIDNPPHGAPLRAGWAANARIYRKLHPEEFTLHKKT
jgi:hypothetical protein